MDFLKDKLTSAPVLKFPNFSLPFFIHADACDVGLGAAGYRGRGARETRLIRFTVVSDRWTRTY